MKVILPQTVEELWRILGDEPEAALLAGGTDLLVKVRAGAVEPAALICLQRLEELRGIAEEADVVYIGACATHTEILSSSVVRTFLPILEKAVHLLGSPPVRNMGTIGGNICTASPAGDTLPALYALGAELELLSQYEQRRLAIDQFILGPGKTALRKGEILAGVRVKKPEGSIIHHFEKVGQRKAMSISIASLAALVRVGQAGKMVEVSLAWGSVGPTVVRSREAENTLVGAELSAEILKKAFPAVEAAVSPIDDVRASAAYRRCVSANLLLRLAGYGRNQ